MEEANKAVAGIGWKTAATALGIPVSFLSLVSIPEKCLASVKAVKSLVSMYSSATIEERIKQMLKGAGEEYEIRFARVDGLSDNELHEAYLKGITEEELFIVQRYSKLERDKLLYSVVAKTHKAWRSRLAQILCFGYTSSRDEAIKAMLDRAGAKKKIRWMQKQDVSHLSFEQNCTTEFYGSINALEVEEDENAQRYKYYVKDTFGWARLEMSHVGELVLYREAGLDKPECSGEILEEISYVYRASCMLQDSCGIRDNIPLACTFVACLDDRWSKDYIRDLESVMKTTISHLQLCRRKMHVNVNCSMPNNPGDKVLARSLIVYNTEQRGIIHGCRGQPHRQKFLKKQFELKPLESQDAVDSVYEFNSAIDLFRGAEEYPNILYEVGRRIKERAAESDTQPKREEAVTNKFDLNLIALFRRYSRTVGERSLLQSLKGYYYYYNQDENSVSILSPANQAFFHYSREDVHVNEEQNEQPFLGSPDKFLAHVSRMLFSEYEDNTPVLRGDDHELTRQSTTQLKKGIHHYLKLRTHRLNWLAKHAEMLTISGIRTTAEAVTKITEVSAAWIVREILVAMHRRGFVVKHCYPAGCSFGETILTLYQQSSDGDVKEIIYDEPVDMAGCEYQVHNNGTIALRLIVGLQNGCSLYMQSRPNNRKMAESALLGGRSELRVSQKDSTLGLTKKLSTMLVE